MSDFIITAETSADVPQEVLASKDVVLLPMHYYLGDEELHPDNYVAADFFAKLRTGVKARTSQINTHAFEEAWTKLLEEGKDVLHLGFSSALSGTYQNAVNAAKDLTSRFPERTILVCDTAAQAGGQGLLIRLVGDYRAQGHTLKECYDYAEDVKSRVVHIFTVNDLRHLISTGRVSNAEAFLGNLLQIKPVLYTSDEGKLTPYIKMIGRKLALNWMCEKTKEMFSGESDRLYVCHGDCPKDAQYVVGKLEPLGAKIEIIDISPVIASHTGPDVLAIFFLGNQRKPI